MNIQNNIDRHKKERIASTYHWNCYRLANNIQEIKERYFKIKSTINEIKELKKKNQKPKSFVSMGISKIIYSLPKSILKKSSKRVLAASSMALVDGPLPVGDILAVGCDVLIGVDTVWDLLSMRKPLRKEIGRGLSEAVSTCHYDLKAQVRDAAGKILEQYNSQLYEILE